MPGMWAPTTVAGSMLARLAARQARVAVQQCSYATVTTSSSSEASADSSEAPSTSGRDPGLFRLWPTGPAVPKHLAEMSFEQLMEHWQTQNHRKFAMGEPKLLLMVRKASSPDQLQQLLGVLRTNYLHHRRASPNVTYSSHLSCALLEAVYATGAGTPQAIALLEQAADLGLTVSQRMCQRLLHGARKSGSPADQQMAWTLAQSYMSDTPNTAVLRERAIAVGSILQRAADGDSAAARYSSQRQRQRLTQEMQQIKQYLESKGNPMPLAVWQALMQAGIIQELPAAIASRKTPKRPAPAVVVEPAPAAADATANARQEGDSAPAAASAAAAAEPTAAAKAGAAAP